ncbi:unnamed protein product [Didymodactylos carnosus]|uniref:RING-type domain-containing protein n=1 Tax=Didymodactylos carnosus TaxID=1234261 RepID=A0A813VPA3_9BILA|nr:unnamed protein product [Didymodactylos carnosus]CAF0839456.1 unnamed protein product [Didymodactylos carnosus]CAF3621165.1 unnamed protein product [Didymodactylos carnosus]CAF3626755.1 unnamed protein product [Didymodactylos carnosus]
MSKTAEFHRFVDYNDLESLLECSLCLDRFQEPRLIPCQHTYCTKCIQELCEGSDTIICPQCRAQHPIQQKQDGVLQFPRNITYQQLLDIKTEQLVSTRQCQVCDKKRAFSDCLHCKKAVCLDCKKLHRRELSDVTDLLINDLTKSSTLCKESLTNEITTFLTNCDYIKKQISSYTKDLIQTLKQQEINMKSDLDKLIIKQIETDNVLDEKFIEIQTLSSKYLSSLQNMILEHKNSRKDIIFTPNITLKNIYCNNSLGELRLSSSFIDNEKSHHLPLTPPPEDMDNQYFPQSVDHQSDDDNRLQQIQQIGHWGSGEREFWCPTGICISHNNYILIVDSWNHRLQMLTIDGQFIRSTRNIKGRGINELNNPRDVCISPMGNEIILSDSGNHRLVVYNEYLEVKRLICDKLNLQFPNGVCSDEQDSLFICDRGNNRIVVVTLPDGAYIRQWGRKGQNQSEFDCPDFICYRQNILAVSDFNNHRVQVFDKYGQFLFMFGQYGCENGQFRYPRGLAIDDEGFFMVADWVNNRLQLFTPNGQLSAIVGGNSQEKCSTLVNTTDDFHIPKVEFDRPIGVAVNKQGVVFVTEWGRSHRLVIY